MSKRDIPLSGGGEYDALTRWRRFCIWRPGARRYWKRRFNRRERAAIRAAMKAAGE